MNLDLSNRRYFPEGMAPASEQEIQSFMASLSKAGPDDLVLLRREISTLAADQIQNFCKAIVPKIESESQLELIFHSSEVIKKMDSATILQAFKDLYSKKYRCIITKDFFEKSLETLANSFRNSIILVGKFLNDHHVRGDAAEWIKNLDMDGAFARQLNELIASGSITHSDYFDIRVSLKRLELPATLGVYIQSKLENGCVDEVVSHLQEMMENDLFSVKYQSIIRQTVDEDLLLSACRSASGSDLTLKSVKRLSKAYGEAAFHHKEFFQNLGWRRRGELPPHIEAFRNVNYDESTFPALAEFVTSDMRRGLASVKHDFSNAHYAVSFCALAGRMGKGKLALHAVAHRLINVASDDRQPSRIFDALRAVQPGSTAIDSVRAYNMLINVIAELGLETLKQVAPDVGGGVVADAVSNMKVKPNSREVIRMFPQAKAAVLENDLGM
jgi:hypothetical protein